MNLNRGCIARQPYGSQNKRPHGIGWENNEQTKLTMEPSPKTKEQRHIRVQLN